MTRTYLDWNATAPLRPEARKAMLLAMDVVGNPSSVHAEGRAAKAIIEAAREQVAALVGAKPSQVIFTSGATEANHLALAGDHGAIAVLATEHESVLQAVPGAERVPVDRNGLIELSRIDALKGQGLLAVQLANSETGVVQPLAEVAERARRKGISVHCDAVQAAGKFAVDFAGLGLRSLSLSAHKFGGPKGVGALIVAEGASVQPILQGGGQERRLRSGTENVIGIAGFGAAAEAAKRGVTGFSLLRRLRDRLEFGIRQVAPEAVIAGEAADRLPNTSAITVKGVSAETLVMALDLAGVAISAGSACSSGKVGRSHVLAAMGLPGSAIRVSTGWATSRDDIDSFLSAFATAVGRISRAAA